MLKNDNNNYKFSIDKFYKNYLKGPRIFNNRDALEPSYIPHELPHRDVQIKDIAEKTACALFGDAPPSFLCYGQTGTGKTATIRYISQKLAQQNTEIKPWWIYINCNVVSTPYRILAHTYNTISRDEKIPPTGLPKDIIFKKLLGLLDSKVKNSICFLVLDEIDILIEKKGGNEILYDLTRLNENLDQCKTSLIGISNKLKFRSSLDPRILSSLGEEFIVFPSYDASELRDILNKRAKIAFHESVLKEDVIPLCAAIAAKEHGDARKALQLLRKAGELAERAQSKSINSKYVERAQDDLEKDHIMEYLKGMPLQAQLVLTAVYLISKYSSDHIITSGDIYEVHSEIRGLIPGVRQLTKRRISDYINELNLAGIISAEVKSMGHYGRTKIIILDIGLDIVEKVLSEIDKIQAILNHKPTLLQIDRVKLKNNIFKKLI
ncbi:MAG: orc1/cdc6 family replication initiation protein [Candidatus Lokiarchaeota archaeon]|nr:orc1/cdc6 family replication initiation protein [Candidatus Lokiarchaeota archaeon]